MITRIQNLYNTGKLTEMQVYNSYKKDYITSTEWNTFYISLPTTSYTQLKTKVLLDLEIWMDNLIITGYPVPTKTFNLAMGFDDRNSFTQQLTLIKSLVEANQLPLSYEMTVLDVNKVEQKMTVQELLTYLPAYGVYVNTVWSTKTGYETYINSLTENSGNRTILENISFSL